MLNDAVVDRSVASISSGFMTTGSSSLSVDYPHISGPIR